MCDEQVVLALQAHLDAEDKERLAIMEYEYQIEQEREQVMFDAWFQREAA